MNIQTIENGVRLRPGLFQRRRDLARSYLVSLTDDGLLQNFELEAGLRKAMLFHDEDSYHPWHWGWESPTSEVRGQFLGCWLMAAARFGGASADPYVLQKLSSVIDRLEVCQNRNGGRWLGSFPEKYMRWLQEGTSPWVPHYVIHKTLMGLRETFLFTGNEKALELSRRFVSWLQDWYGPLEQSTRETILDVETGGMLEELALLFKITRAPEHLELARLYSRERFWNELLSGRDVLTNRHANTTVAEILGAAAMYEVTGESRWKDITEAYWKCAVIDRGTFCTGGQNSGEIWCPPHEFASRLGDRTQEHCTVYNMIRLAEYLFRWTGNSVYGDYIEKNLYNGILAAQNERTGMVAYYLPLGPGLKKKWGSPTTDFWCCHGSLVQAHSYLPTLIYQESESGIIVSQYVPSQLEYSYQGTPIKITQGWSWVQGGSCIDNATVAGDLHRSSAWSMRFKIECAQPIRWTLSLRIPSWISASAILQRGRDETPIQADESGFFQIDQVWSADEFTLVLPRKITLSRIPDEPDTVAFLEGPIVLAGLTEEERRIEMDKSSPEKFLVPENERTWGNWNDSFRLKGQTRGLHFKPLYEITDEAYAVYFPVCEAATKGASCPCG